MGLAHDVRQAIIFWTANGKLKVKTASGGAVNVQPVSVASHSQVKILSIRAKCLLRTYKTQWRDEVPTKSRLSVEKIFCNKSYSR